jgi:predicted  nucleic acid-binding Zn-ribbon protein
MDYTNYNKLNKQLDEINKQIVDKNNRMQKSDEFDRVQLKIEVDKLKIRRAKLIDELNEKHEIKTNYLRDLQVSRSKSQDQS